MNSPAALSPNPNVLIIDDNRDGLLVRRSLLEELGYNVETAIDGEEGLKLFQTARFDVVVTDFRMPRMDGKEVIQGSRKLNPNARVILLSWCGAALSLSEQNMAADAGVATLSTE